jgi:hypothetical protein
LLDRAFNPLCQSRKALRLGQENYVAARYVGLRVPQPERLIERSQGLHLDLVVATDIDAAKHGHNHSHSGSSISAGRVILQRPQAQSHAIVC